MARVMLMGWASGTAMDLETVEDSVTETEMAVRP